MTEAITINIVEAPCPLCNSVETRSKVCDSQGVWWFVCDNDKHPHYIRDAGKLICLRDDARALARAVPKAHVVSMFYFTLDGRIELPNGKQFTLIPIAQE